MDLEIGSGENPQPGYLHTDIYVDDRNRHLVDIVCDAHCLPFGNACFDSILMFGVFEHFGFYEIQIVMLEVCRVLKKGGVFKFDVPDFDWFLEIYRTGIDPNTRQPVDPNKNTDWALSGIFGWQRQNWDFHRWGWNEVRLRKFLEKPNWEFSTVTLVGRQWRDPESNHLIWECLK